LFKERIRTNFDNAAVNYDRYASVQQKSAQVLFELIKANNISPKRVIDVGCGTGFLSAKLINEFTDADFILNDLSPNMLEIAKSKFTRCKRVAYQLADAEDKSFDQQGIDLISSNLSLQWFSNPKRGIANLWKQTECFLNVCLKIFPMALK
jgi:malonyl-CoA O-methyltransferase